MSMLRLFALVSIALLTMTAQAGTPWRGVHLGVGTEAELDELGRQILALAKAGVNQIVVEIDYNFEFKSRPEMAKVGGVTKDGARAFVKICRSNHIQVIPQINCLGHQSWAANTDTLLRVHPELDETPGQFPNNKGIYCRSYCPLNPGLHAVLYPLIDELIDAFQAKMFHVGMDEVFILGDAKCPLCHDVPKDKLFATAVNDLHDHLKSKHVRMLMWADRFLDGKATGYGEWEASENGTWNALDEVPKDIILCDWHYEPRTDYPSIQRFRDKGFEVWPSTWRNVKAAGEFSQQGKNDGHGKVLGVLVTTWGSVGSDGLATWPPLVAALQPWK